VIDFHCHLDLYPSPQNVVSKCVEQGLYVLSVTTTPSAWSGTSALATGKNRIRTALGLHPQLVHERKSELPLFDRFLPEARYIGEIGLDGTSEFRSSWNDQIAVFKHILASCAEAGGRILSIHSRQASSEVLDCLRACPTAGIPVLHWFSGSTKDLDRAIDLGCWFSIGPAMLTSSKGRMLAIRMPQDRVLTETDGPFAQLAGKPAMPWDSHFAVNELAKIWDFEVQELEGKILSNLRALTTRL
jgi:TatD DNase family protein